MSLFIVHHNIAFFLNKSPYYNQFNLCVEAFTASTSCTPQPHRVTILMTCLFKTKTKFDHVSILITSYFHNSQPLCSRCHCLGCQCNSMRGILYDSYFVIQRIWHLYVKSVLQRWIMSTKDSLSFHQYGCHVFIILIPMCQTAIPWFLPSQISGTACRIANYLGIFSVVIGLNRIFWLKQSQLQLQKALRFTI